MISKHSKDSCEKEALISQTFKKEKIKLQDFYNGFQQVAKI
jgi:hypothetical protein